jgi:hypothetical protein
VNRVSNLLVRCFRALFRAFHLFINRRKSMASTRHSLFPCSDWVVSTLDLLCGRDVANGGQIRFFVACRIFVTASTQSVSCFRWNHFVPLSTGLRVPSDRPWEVPWTGLRPLWTRFAAEMWRTAEQRCPNFSRRSHKKPTHVSVFCDSFDSICLVELEQSSFYCTVCAHSRLYTSLSIMVEPPVPLNWKKTVFWMIF